MRGGPWLDTGRRFGQYGERLNRPCLCPCHTSRDPDIRADAYLCDECDGSGFADAIEAPDA